MNNNSEEWFKNYVSKNRLFILGAGFSDVAKIPLTDKLLKLTMSKFAGECPGIYERVNNYAKACFSTNEELDYSKINFSDLCTFLEYQELREYGGGERWSNEGSREKLALKFYIAKTIAEHTPGDDSIPEIYLRFAEQLHENDIILNFNWDCLLEVALKKIGKEYTYSFEENRVKICKLHGSVNWRLDAPEELGKPIKQNILGWQPLNLAHGLMPVDIYQSNRLIYFKNFQPFQPLGQVQPLLVLPGYGKAFDVRNIAVLWYKPEWALAFTHDVYIIGLGLAPDDFFIRSFFLDNLSYIDSFSGIEGREIIIINPSQYAEENYDFILENKCARLINDNFQISHVEEMRKKIKIA